MKVTLRNVSMAFNGVTAVSGVNAVIEHGQLVALLGPSGCGKSTTLFLLAGLYRPTGGEILFGDQSMNGIEPERRGIGMVFQNYALYPHMSVLKNIMFPLKMNKTPKREALDRAKRMADLVHISHLLDRKPGQLSGGQQQRVAIARALVKNPELLLLDEPLSNLDARLRLEMREEIRRIQQEVGITTIFVTHDQEEAMSISDKVLLMNEGVVQQFSSPQHLYKEPVNIFSAEFIGNPRIDLLDVVWHDEMGKLKLEGFDEPFSLPLEEFGPLEPGGRYKLGVRAEDWLAVDPGKGVLQGTIAYIETIGRDTLVRVEAGALSLKALLDADSPWRAGMKVGLAIRPRRAHLFDARTGASMRAKQPLRKAVLV